MCACCLPFVLAVTFSCQGPLTAPNQGRGCLGSLSCSWPWASCSDSPATAHMLHATMPGCNPWAGTAVRRTPGNHRRHRQCCAARCQKDDEVSRGSHELVICGLELAVALREAVNEAKGGEMVSLLNEKPTTCVGRCQTRDFGARFGWDAAVGFATGPGTHQRGNSTFRDGNQVPGSHL